MLISTSKLFKNNKIARVRRASAILQEKLQEKSCYFLLIMYIKSITESQDRQKFGERARAIFNLHSCYMTPVSTQSEALSFFLYIIITDLALSRILPSGLTPNNTFCVGTMWKRASLLFLKYRSGCQTYLLNSGLRITLWFIPLSGSGW